MTFPRHHLSWADFDALARGGGGTAVVALLRGAERSRRLLLLRALVDRTTKDPELCGPLPAADVAWELLERVEHTAPEALDLVLAHPYTGTWAGYVTRLLRDRIAGTLPLWVHLGHVHSIAAAAAVRARLAFSTWIPVWQGCASLPTLGLARLSGDSPVVRIVGGRDTLEIGPVRLAYPYTSDTAAWWAVRRSFGGLSVRLDDVDPYRGFRDPVGPERIDESQIAAWRVLLDDAWRLLAAHVPELAASLAAGLDSLVPRPGVSARSASASSEESFGSVVVTRPRDALSLAATLVHEFQHVRLGGLLRLVPLYSDESAERSYSPWRDDPRPVAGVFQGIYAFFGVASFWRAVALADGSRLAWFEFAYRRRQVVDALSALRGDACLTSAGRRFLAGVSSVLDSWGESVPGDVADAVDLVVLDHRAGWRIRHLRPSADAVAGLRDAWRGGSSSPLPPAGLATPVPDGSWSDDRLVLVRGRMGGGRVAGSAASVALVDGRYVDAVRGFRAELAADPDRASAWVGLGLALDRLGRQPAGRVLLRRPEVVRAVYRAVRGGGVLPDAVAGWLGRIR